MPGGRARYGGWERPSVGATDDRRDRARAHPHRRRDGCRLRRPRRRTLAVGRSSPLIVALLAVDLVVHRGNHEPTARRALVESAVWVACGLGFGAVVLASWGGQAFGEYLSGYVIEKSLSVDNVFVWAVIFSTFAIPLRYQHRVLFWGIFGALDAARGLHLRRHRAHRAVLVDAARVRCRADRVRHQGRPPPRRRGRRTGTTAR